MIVLRHEKQFLLLKRGKEPNKGKYVPVGGKLDPFEDPYSAAVRETREETGIDVEHLQYAGVLIESSPTAYNWQCNIYVADIPYQEVPYCDEGELSWIPYEQIPDLPTPPTDWIIYQYLMRGQVFAFNAILDEQLNLLSMDDEIRGERVWPISS
ncbi:NUDIX hydrolase [Flavilitoribacter nigricans DSM 23189 = NBRC 102662]|uniref:NUDIX hydrolase n=2 Tax=Flavilitoribacter TaxID=2762562 RepID=A0A2D0N8B2_FLAN2|nr:NUDIX hydrolase [Flavilitoribacter nigricans DSM 23189 = NBRC 102662]